MKIAFLLAALSFLILVVQPVNEKHYRDLVASNVRLSTLFSDEDLSGLNFGQALMIEVCLGIRSCGTDS
ncbi:hypothetical protein [Moritella sp. F3]|uniref:hypothetical protein n=1 Tax=Moritella sp. F3 TaxID=2718882 RepID=UPI0018E12D57|nr:hypothetical protein [Moritella sp. F3]GIC77145.1 hypothetical protein FMO001_18720 [Moritella sp. F1]GIC82264.1 hypothetical protein FMO003_25450 [Moritella sp. F3]